jgi:hypothetical protein
MSQAGESIKRRTVYFSKVNGSPLEFHDWASVVTSLGQMVEPFEVNQKVPAVAFSADDDMSRIDQLERIDPVKQKIALTGTDYALHGGAMMPRG